MAEGLDRMRKSMFAGAVLAVALVLTTGGGFDLRASETIGAFTTVMGDVQLRNNKAQRMAAETGMDVEIGHMIKTRDASVAEIRLADESLFRVAANSSLVMDEFVLDSNAKRGMTTRLLGGAMQYASKPGLFKSDKRKIFLGNVSASVRGTNFIGIMGPRYQVILLEGEIELSARSNSVILNRRGQTVFLDPTGTFDEAFILPDEELIKYGERLGWEIELPPPPPKIQIPLQAIGCAIVGQMLVCG